MTDPRIDAYIEKAADFAKPILSHLRKVVHEACPEVEETIKWGMPHFDYRGQMMCSMASFKAHCAFGFWKVKLLPDPQQLLDTENAMGHFGRITRMEDLPSDEVLKFYIYEAMKLNEEGVKLAPKPKTQAPKELAVPMYFSDALCANPNALAAFESFAPSQKREYVDWITEAKTEATRQKRLETAIEWMAEGKTRHWKYQKK